MATRYNIFPWKKITGSVSISRELLIPWPYYWYRITASSSRNCTWNSIIFHTRSLASALRFYGQDSTGARVYKESISHSFCFRVFIALDNPKSIFFSFLSWFMINRFRSIRFRYERVEGLMATSRVFIMQMNERKFVNKVRLVEIALSYHSRTNANRFANIFPINYGHECDIRAF